MQFSRWLNLGLAVALSCLGLFFLYAGSVTGRGTNNFARQGTFLLIALLAFLLFSRLDYRIFKTSRVLLLALYILGLLLLTGVLLFGSAVRGTHTWYNLGPVSFDPIELVKIVLLLLLAKYFSSRHVELYKLKHILISSVYVLPMVGLVLIQPNLGSAALLVAIWLGILIISGIRLRHFALLVLLFVLLMVVGWQFGLQDYQKQRIISFLWPQTEPLGTGWQQAQAKIAIGSGGLFGQGLGRGPQVRYGFLPEADTDFIFAGLAEELGLVGMLVLFGLYIALFWRLARAALLAGDNFQRLFAGGFFVLLLSQTAINIGMNLGLLPIVGIPLPFVSHGGSGLVANYVVLGILQNMGTQNS